MTIFIRSRGYLSADHANNCPKTTAMLQAQGIFKKATLRSQKGHGMGRLKGSPIGGELGRAFLREWQESAAAMPQPLSDYDKELLRQSYIYGYANLPLPHSSFPPPLPTGRKTGAPIGGEPGRAVKRAWEDAAAAMPQPLSSDAKEALRTAYIHGYAAIGIDKSRQQASEAVKNPKKKSLGPD